MSRIPVLGVLLAAILGAAAPPSRYFTASHKYAAALLEHGRDHYGLVETPLLVHMLDLRTLEIPKQRTVAEWRAEMATWREDPNYLMWGKDRSSTEWAHDSNLLWDTENVRLFYALTRATGDTRFRGAADEYLRYFLKCCVSRTTGLFAWGEHVAYNVVDDQVRGKRHELQHAQPLWEELWKFGPDAVRQEIEGIYHYHITDKRSMAYDRHANYWNGMPERDQATILGYTGTFVAAFAFLEQKTGEEKYQDWARRLVLAFQSKSDENGLYPDNWTDRQAREQPYTFPPRPNISLGMHLAYELTGDKRWLDDANRYLDACARRVFAEWDKSTEWQSAQWSFIESAVRSWRATGERRYLDMAVRMGDRVLAWPQPRAQMAALLADRLNSLMTLCEATGEARWLDGARRAGDYALRAFVHPSGLIRGTAVVDRPDYYDAIQGPGALALALFRLGQLDAATGPRR